MEWITSVLNEEFFKMCFEVLLQYLHTKYILKISQWLYGRSGMQCNRSKQTKFPQTVLGSVRKILYSSIESVFIFSQIFYLNKNIS